MNGRGRQLRLDSQVTSLDALRDELDLTGTKKVRPGRVRRLHGAA
jgi:aerobic-type carbon monoxide dehydrogenase small subunit (CoxS/CutS family)